MVAFATLSAGLLIIALGLIAKARRQTVVTGLQRLVGNTAVVESMHSDSTMIRLDGELRQIQSIEPVHVNDIVSVTNAGDVVLIVKKYTSNKGD